MREQLYVQNIEAAFATSFQNNGAESRRFSLWLDMLSSIVPRLKAQPQPEAKSLFSLPSRTDDLHEIEDIAMHIAGNFNTLVVAGMGGSSLSGETLARIRKPGGLNLRFIDNIDPHSMHMLTETIDWDHTAFLIISKSGNTVESLAQMAVLLRQAKSRLDDYAKHFYVITVLDGNPLHTLSKEHGIRFLGHDPKLGGRFSVLSSVGLIPAAAIGLDIRSLRAGAQSVLDEVFSNGSLAPAIESAALHMALMEKDIHVNVMMYYCDRLGGLADWYRQCWGESLGKCSKATTPVRARGTTDQHSQLQLYLDGPKDKLFTLMMLESAGQGERIDFDEENDTRLDFLKAHTLGDLMVAEQQATFSALVKNNCPVRCFTMEELNEEVLGALLMHFALEVILTAQLLNVNAFDQPAVEQSKAFALHYLAGDNELSLRAG
jgi:glucose-6-phosphate isomerase